LVTTTRTSTVKFSSFGSGISAMQSANTTPHTHITNGSSSYGYNRALEKLKF
jgi:hypothetical protein